MYFFHRVVLTRENPETHQIAISVVRQVVRAAEEIMDTDRARTKGITCKSLHIEILTKYQFTLSIFNAID